MTLAIGIGCFGGGVWLLVESVEGLVKAVRGWAAAAGISGAVLSALVLGFDVESTAAGVAATLDDLPGTALGTSIGAAIFLLTVGLGVAALVAPFAVRTPPALLATAGVAAALAIALSADGALSRIDGAVLALAFPPLVAVLLRSRRGPAPAREGTRPDRLALRLGAALVGLVAGAELLVFGTGRVVSEIGLSETVFGLLVVAAAVSFEEVVLEALPAYRGFPELSVGNALGTLIFLLTASLGVIVLVRPLAVPDGVVEFHLPALALSAILAGVLLARGRLGRPEGVLLLFAYAIYVAGAIAVG
ncbi:MAG: sodium:calcium antiporter [Thermoleophilaceae bacterium]